MAEEAKAQKDLEKFHIQAIAQLHVIVEKQQANGVSAKLNALLFQIFTVIKFLILQPSPSRNRPRSLKFVICFIGCVLAFASFIGLIVYCCVKERPWIFEKYMPAFMIMIINSL
jgi:hypothetical protein